MAWKEMLLWYLAFSIAPTRHDRFIFVFHSIISWFITVVEKLLAKKQKYVTSLRLSRVRAAWVSIQLPIWGKGIKSLHVGRSGVTTSLIFDWVIEKSDLTYRAVVCSCKIWICIIVSWFSGQRVGFLIYDLEDFLGIAEGFEMAEGIFSIFVLKIHLHFFDFH